jgi:hypothetical protein
MHHDTFLVPSSMESLEKKYKLLLDVATSVHQNFLRIQEAIKKAGGLKEYTAYLRRQAIERLMVEAPMHVHIESKGFNMQVLSKFVLEHLGTFNYDMLYGGTVYEAILVKEEEGEMTPEMEEYEASKVLGFWCEDSLKFLEMTKEITNA